MPAAGLPVASMTMSMNGLAISASVSSVTKVVALRAASSSDPTRKRSSGQPTRRIASCARAGERSETPTRWMPGVRHAWDRNIEPNFPAPIRPTRAGLPSAARSLSLANIDIAFLRRRGDATSGVPGL